MKKRYISIFLFILLVSAFFVYHLYPRDVKEIVIEDRSVIDSVKVYSFDTEACEAKLITLIDGELTSFLALLQETDAYLKIAKNEYFNSTRYYRIFIHEAGIGTRSALCDVEYYVAENVISINGVQYVIFDPMFHDKLLTILEH